MDRRDDAESVRGRLQGVFRGPAERRADEDLRGEVRGVRRLEDAYAVAGITWANGHLDTPKGRIRVSWKLVDGKLQVDSSVPDGVKVVTR